MDWDMDTGKLNWTPEFYTLFGLDPKKDTASIDTWRSVLHPEDRQRTEEKINESINERKPLIQEYRIIMPSVEVRWIDAFGDTLYDESGKAVRMSGICIDISESIKASELLHESEEKYRILFDNSVEGILIADSETRKFKYANPAICRMLGYTEKELITMDISAIHLKKDLPGVLAVFQDLVRGIYPHAADIPCLRKNGALFYADISVTNIIIDGRKCTAGFFQDITGRKKAEEDIKASYKKTEIILEETIKTLATIVEIKDPYTSGHQQKVAKIATFIAIEMGLEQDRVHGMNITALIHDIGKINIPASILSKPGKLSELEYEMIKTHPKIGYDMLKNIDFPWPVADIVLQHHERENGSGYPNKIMGENIFLEAKIIAVADVVEAMASHRPYRPSLGIDQALKEIEINKGILYDPDVVDVCIKLFRQDKFEL